MSEVTMCTRESDINVKYGLFDLREEREMARSSLKYIYADMTDIKRSYFNLGFHLHEFRQCKYYEDFGYPSFEEFCEANFEMDKGAVSRCINVFLMASAYNDKVYVMGTETHGCAMEISDKFREYNYSQLCEMLPLSDKQRNKIKPEMTIKQIREIKNQPDITERQVLGFVDYFRNKVKPFTRSALMELLGEKAKTYNSHCGPGMVGYQLKPGKVSIDFGEYYSFSKVLDFYEKCGGEFEAEEVATSQPELVKKCNEPEVFQYVDEIVKFDDEDVGSPDFVTALWDCIEDVLDAMVYQLLIYSRSGKSFEIETMDGEKYKLLFMAANEN